MVKKYVVYYQNHNENHSWFVRDITLENFLSPDYTFLKFVDAEDLEDVFRIMNNWTPNGLEKQIINDLTWHTSMSVNDVICDTETKKYYQVMPVGFREILDAKKETEEDELHN